MARALEALANERKLPLLAVGRPEFDLSDAGVVDRTVTAYSPRAIVNAAAYTFVDKAESEPEKAMQINGTGPGILAEEARKKSEASIHSFEGLDRRSDQEQAKASAANT